MARRAKPHEEELPFVALMDTMTNVVGVLIIVLVMIGIGLAKSVRKVLSDLPPVPIEEHEKLKKEVEKLQPKKDPKEVEDETKILEQELKKSTEELQTMEVSKDQQKIKIVDLDDLQKQLETRKKERETKKAAVDRLLAELDKMKAQLDTTPVYQPPPATIVKLPNPRPMPDKAEVQHFLVIGGRVIYTNDEQFNDLVEAELKKSESALAISRETVKGPDGKPVMVKDKSGRSSPQRKIVFDPKKLTDHFARLRLGSREIKVEVVPSPASPRIPIKLTPLPNAGETPEQTKNLVSVFQTLVRKFKANPKAVIWFHVYKDSLPTYLAVRDIADQLGVPVGWDIYGSPAYVRNLPAEYSVPVTAPAKPAADPGRVIIAPPKTTLD